MNTYRQKKLKKFTSDKLALAGLIMVVFLFLTALFAPFLANGRPLLVIADRKISFPFLQTFFAPDSSEYLIEQFFNYILLVLLCIGLSKFIPAKLKNTKK